MNHPIARPVLLTTALALSLVAPTFAAKKPITGLPLVWKPTTELSEIGAVNLTGLGERKLELSAVVDAREEKTRIGENVEDGKGNLTVSTNDDPAAWLTDQLRFVFGKTGIDFAASGGETKVSLELRRFFVTEKDTYSGEIAVRVKIIDAKGKVLFEGMASGGAERFGRSYKPENYQETLSDSVIDLVKKLVASPDFMAGLRGGR